MSPESTPELIQEPESTSALKLLHQGLLLQGYVVQSEKTQVKSQDGESTVFTVRTYKRVIGSHAPREVVWVKIPAEQK